MYRPNRLGGDESYVHAAIAVYQEEIDLRKAAQFYSLSSLYKLKEIVNQIPINTPHDTQESRQVYRYAARLCKLNEGGQARKLYTLEERREALRKLCFGELTQTQIEEFYGLPKKTNTTDKSKLLSILKMTIEDFKKLKTGNKEEFTKIVNLAIDSFKFDKSGPQPLLTNTEIAFHTRISGSHAKSSYGLTEILLQVDMLYNTYEKKLTFIQKLTSFKYIYMYIYVYISI